MSAHAAQDHGVLKRRAIILSWPGWIMLFVGFVLADSSPDFFPNWISSLIPTFFFIACLICSPASMVLFIMSFRGAPGVAIKLLWILWAGIPILFGLLFGML